ncbi:unnamed protein product [Dracunculus medinensis]|uniref:Rif1_N domain-containing protein n=1 Tax=Dracunculus medinensis TaxID=318479 RepID=A0A158Q402_DRAME|nr:unnamed protein product [Dracunculus medinensis]
MVLSFVQGVKKIIFTKLSKKKPEIAKHDMRFLSMRFLSERNLLFSASCFVKIFAEYFQESSMIEEFVPVWLVVNMINTEDEDMVQSSNFVYNGLSAFFAQRGFNIIDKKLNYVSAIEVSQWIFKVIGEDCKNRICISQWINLWIDKIVSVLTHVLPDAQQAAIQHSCRICSFIFLYCAPLIFKTPSECIFNRSPFVCLCKLYLQNLVKSLVFYHFFRFFLSSKLMYISEIYQNLPVDLIEDIIPNFIIGLVKLPISTTPYLFRLLIDAIERFSSNFFINEKLCEILQPHSDLIQKLRCTSSRDSNVHKFISSFFA